MAIDGVDFEKHPQVLDAVDGIEFVQSGKAGGDYRADRLRRGPIFNELSG